MLRTSVSFIPTFTRASGCPAGTAVDFDAELLEVSLAFEVDESLLEPPGMFAQPKESAATARTARTVIRFILLCLLRPPAAR